MSGWRERLDELIAAELEEQAIANSGNIGNFGDAIEPQTDATQKKERSICNSPHFENSSPYPSPYQDAKTAEIAKTHKLARPATASTHLAELRQKCHNLSWSPSDPPFGILLGPGFPAPKERLDLSPTPETIDSLIEAARHFMASPYWPLACALGWSDIELFAIHEIAPKIRHDAMGLVPAIAWSRLGVRLVELQAENAILTTRSGSRLTRPRALRSNGASISWLGPVAADV